MLKSLLGKGVRVNLIAPGPVDTDFSADLASMAPKTLLGRLGKPEEVAHAVKFLVENQFVTGQTIRVDGGFGMGAKSAEL